ncbi:MAG: hypothetical protein IKX25_06445 [Bacteroidales bacterium]|nr:hypothetical protein [Bacteroidales bacterium]
MDYQDDMDYLDDYDFFLLENDYPDRLLYETRRLLTNFLCDYDRERSYNIYNLRVFSEYIRICRSFEEETKGIDISKLDIEYYFLLKRAFDDFSAATICISNILRYLRNNYKHWDFDIVDDNLDYLQSYSGDETVFVKQKAILESTEVMKSSINNLIDATIDLFESMRAVVDNNLSHIREGLKSNEEFKVFILENYRRYAASSCNGLKHSLEKYAKKLKANRLEPLSRIHWAKLADLDDEIDKKIADGEEVDYNACRDYYESSELRQFKWSKELLTLLRKYSNPEELFDWNMLFRNCFNLSRVLNENNVYFFFNRVHRENLIKCELYDGLAEQYHQFLYGSDEKDEATEAAPQVPAKTNTESSAASDGSINKRIDVAKLIGFIRSYTDGQYKSNYFNKKSYWLSIYIVLRQNLEQLDGSPIFLPASRPKFVEWVNANIKPDSVPCEKGSLDTPPSYFRNEKNYPWDINGFYKAGFAQEKTFNGYSMVADYFQKNLIENLQDFMIPADKGSETY